MVRGRGVRDPGGASQLSERDSVGTPLGNQVGGLREDNGLQITVVVGIPAHVRIIPLILTMPRSLLRTVE
jgi:hypothetical protein